MTTNKTEKRLEIIESIAGSCSLSNDEKNVNIWCPFCNNPNKYKKKLVIHLEKCIYHCWVCSKSGRDINYLLKKFNKKLNYDFSIFKSYKKLTSIFNLDTEIEEEVNLHVELPDDFYYLSTDFNTVDPDCRDVLKYAIKRGFTKHKLWMLRVGYSKNSSFLRYLILPSYNKNGDLNFYVSRKIDAKTKDSYKYKNASISKKHIIFNEINIDWNLPITIVEGPLDLLKTNDNATCLLGSSLTEDMLLFREIVKNKTSVYLALDADVYYKTIKIAKLLSQYDIEVKIIDTRGFEDVGEMSTSEFINLYDNAKPYSETDSLLSKIRLL